MKRITYYTKLNVLHTKLNETKRHPCHSDCGGDTEGDSLVSSRLVCLTVLI